MNYTREYQCTLQGCLQGALILPAAQDTLASWQHPLLGGKLEVMQAVPGGRWFLVPTPAFKVRPASNKQLMTFNNLKSTFTGPHPALTAGPRRGACAYKRTHAFLGVSRSCSSCSLQRLKGDARLLATKLL